MAKKYISEKIRMKTEARLAAVQATYVIAVTENPVEEVIKDFVDGKVGRDCRKINGQGRDGSGS